MNSKPRVIHFVTGGGSGATKVAIDVACGHLNTGAYEPLLVLRRKKVSLPAPMQAKITAAGLRTAWVERWPKSKTLSQLAVLIADFRPQLFVAHGNSEHFWGRQAAFAAKVPIVVHVEHNCERYRFWRRWSAQRLAHSTTATFCVSKGVAAHVRKLRLASSRLEIVHNGVEVIRFSAGAPPFAARGQDIVMMARFARQKDQPTLIRAAKRLADQGWSGQLLLGGGGKSSNRSACEKLAARLGIRDRVEFLGAVGDIAPVLHRCRAAVLSTHHEGLPLSLVEYMSAGCAAIATDVPGVTDIIQPGVNGWLFPEGDDAMLAKILSEVLAGGRDVEAVAARGHVDASARFSLEKMIAHYEALFGELLVPVS